MNEATKSKAMEVMDTIKRLKQVGSIEKIIGVIFLAISLKILTEGSELKGGAVALEETCGKCLNELENN